MLALTLMIIRHAEKPKRVWPGSGLTIKGDPDEKVTCHSRPAAGRRMGGAFWHGSRQNQFFTAQDHLRRRPQSRSPATRTGSRT
jgi:hypothetical protein